MPGSVHSQEPQEQDQSMMDAEPEAVDPIMLDEKRIIVVRRNPRLSQAAHAGFVLTVRAVARFHRDSGVIPIRGRGPHYG